MANGTNVTETITPVQKTTDQKMEQVTVTIVPEKEFAAILTIDTQKFVQTAFKLQDAYDNESMFQRDALHEASVLFLKAQCQRAIGTWDNLVTKMSKTPRYKNTGRADLEKILKIHPKCKDVWKFASDAAIIKAGLR